MQAILCLNTGSSSIKFAIYTMNEKASKEPLDLLGKGNISGISQMSLFSFSSAANNTDFTVSLPDYSGFDESFQFLIDWLSRTYPNLKIVAAGHRIVHGGMRITQPTLLTKEVIDYLTTLAPLAPLHQLNNLKGITVLNKLYPKIIHIGCFDTAFHHTQPALNSLYALPLSFTNEGIKKYGFHGLSYTYIAEKLSNLLPMEKCDKTIVAHLGHGASMCALKSLKSVATTMGMTALDGLVMGKRCGSVDPGVLLYLLAEKKYTTKELEDLLYTRSGLLGLSGVSDDMKELLCSDKESSQFAIDYFCTRIQQYFGSLNVSLQGVDCFVLTGGIGEHAPVIRSKICQGLSFMGMQMDEGLNLSYDSKTPACLSTKESKISIWVIPTNEELIIAQQTYELILHN